MDGLGRVLQEQKEQKLHGGKKQGAFLGMGEARTQYIQRVGQSRSEGATGGRALRVSRPF